MIRTALLFVALLVGTSVHAQLIPPPRRDGFVYPLGGRIDPDTILIEAYFDPVCPDCRDAWEPLKLAVDHYGSRVALVIHLMPLPFHDNAFVVSRALHIVDTINTNATFSFLEGIFKHQALFYNSQTQFMPRPAVVDKLSLVLFGNADAAASVRNLTNKTEKCKCSVINDSRRRLSQLIFSGVSFDAVKSSVSICRLASTDLSLASNYFYLLTLCFHLLLTCHFNSFIFSHGLPMTPCVLQKNKALVKLGTVTLGSSFHYPLKSGFRNSQSDLATRVSFKYSVSRGVSSTPTFYVNGFELPDAGSPIDFEGWKNTIDPLVKPREVKIKDTFLSFLTQPSY